jgi:hypothetical protein
VQFSYFAFPDPFSAVPRASGSVFMFYAPGPVFDGTEGVGSSFHILRSPRASDSFFAVEKAFWSNFMFYAPGLVFDGIEGVGSCFNALRPRHILGGIEGAGSSFHILRFRTCF